MAVESTIQGGKVDDRAAKVLVVASDRANAKATMAWLATASAGCFWIAEDRKAAVEAARAYQPEVAIVELGFCECDGPSVALQLRLFASHLEIVFFAAPNDDAEIAAARDLGLERVLPFDHLFGSLHQILAPLAESVRLRRRLDEVERVLRQLPVDPQSCVSRRRITLPEAERRYREIYIRSLLTETGNRRETARQAGIPYTTLCEIIRKLGITESSTR